MAVIFCFWWSDSVNQQQSLLISTFPGPQVLFRGLEQNALHEFPKITLVECEAPITSL